jgi:hypothetical protein
MPPRTIEKTIEVYSKQADFLNSTALWRAFAAGIGAGKALALDTPIPTPTGWTTMEKVQPDDVIFDEYGTPCRVVGVGPIQYDRPCREVLFSDDTRIVADAEHEWVTYTFAHRKALGRCRGGPISTKPSLVTTQQIANTLFYSGRIANHAIPLAGPLDCQPVTLPIQPYTMGAWLGDGTTREATITSADHEVLESIQAEGYSVEKCESQQKSAASLYNIFSVGHRRQRDPNSGQYYSDPDCVHVILRELGLSGGKFILRQYLRASIDQRRSLLCGLMDTDGCIDERGRCEFTTTNKQLADGFLELCRSLRIKTTLGEGRATLYGVDHGPKYRFSFTPYWPVFTIKRKLDRQKQPGKQASRQLLRYVEAVNEVPSVPVRCIEVDSPSHQYLAGDGMVPTHNSWIGALDMIRRAKPGRLYMVTAPTYTMLEDSSFRSFVEVAWKLGVVNEDGIKRSQPPHVNLLTGAEILFRSADKPDSLRGPNLSGVWMDEASLCEKELFDILIGRLRQEEMGWGTATFTPKGKLHWTYKLFGTGDPDTFLVRARSDENPFLPKNFVAKIRARYTAQQIRQELEGLFIDAGGNFYFPDSWPKYIDMGDAYRIADGMGGWKHIRKADCSRLLALDWAMGKPKKDAAIKERMTSSLDENDLKGDCTAFIVADMSDDDDGFLFLLQAVNQRIPLANNAPRLADMCRQWTPIVVSGDDDNLSETMLLECRRYRDIPSIKTMPIRSKNKVTRSQAAIVRAERGKVFLPERESRLDHLTGNRGPWVEMLKDHLAAFTGVDGEPDDLADAMSILGRLADEFRPGEADTDDDPVFVSGYNPSEGMR